MPQHSKIDSLIQCQLSINIWTNVYGVARSILGLSTLLTLLTNDIHVLFRPYAGGPDSCISCTSISSFSIFCLMSLKTAKWISIFILIFVVSGLYPRITALFHAWVTTSLMNSAILVDGGDQVTTVLSVLIVPIAMTDSRTWVWQRPCSQVISISDYSKIKLMIAHSAWLVIRLQVALIYFEACVGKFKTTEWVNGTAIYYWVTNAQFGLSEKILHLFLPLLSNPVFVVSVTWGVMIFEALLALGICIDNRYWKKLLAAGLVFHFFIFLVHGLPTFFLAMCSALLLYLRRPDQIFQLHWPRVSNPFLSKFFRRFASDRSTDADQKPSVAEEIGIAAAKK
ncbi:MAG TPA: sporulation-delaying protein SdpB family protein [Puia sp.]|nr:sporulation-delaying protein SdpB family protein [Puia sp.]